MQRVGEVYFDDFKVEHVKSPVIESSDYFPFGLTFNNYRRENSLSNQVKFQGQEHQDELDLGWDSFKWRNHQPEIGRFFNIDPLSEKYYHYSPYTFSGNEVTSAIELEGLEPLKLRDGVQTLILVNQGWGNNPPDGKTQAQNAGNKDEQLGSISKLDKGSTQVGVYTASFSSNTMDDMASTISSFQEANPEGKVIMVGHSKGADNLVEMAQDHPDLKIDQMFLLDLVSVSRSTEVPENVKNVTNWFQSNDSPSGSQVTAENPDVTNIQNIPVTNSGHRSIDNNMKNIITSLLMAMTGQTTKANDQENK